MVKTYIGPLGMEGLPYILAAALRGSASSIPPLTPTPEWGRPPPPHTRAKLSAFLASPSDNTSADSSAQFDNRSGTDSNPGASPAVTPAAAASRVDAVPSQLDSQAVLGSTMTAEAEAGF